ncbi:MAG: hypothetical protein IKB88_04955 [Clostridia bacterium]|nr:hypothetical protein [Clostridia bacterium]
MKKDKKIKLSELPNEINNLNKSGFFRPHQYKLGFPAISFCKYCKTPFFSKRIGVFKDSESGKIVCNCPRCGGRHTTTTKKLKNIKTFYKVLGITLVVFIFFLIISFSVT